MIRINLLPLRALKRKENIRKQISVFLLSVLALAVILGGVYLQLRDDVSVLLDEKGSIVRTWDNHRATLNVIQSLEFEAASLDKRLELIINLIKERSGPIKLLDEIIKLTPEDEIWLTELTQNQETVTKYQRAEPKPKKKSPPAKTKSSKAGSGRKERINLTINTIPAKIKLEAPLPPEEVRVEVTILSLAGVAKDNQHLARYIKLLEESEMIKKVTLLGTEQTFIKGMVSGEKNAKGGKSASDKGIRLKKFNLKCEVDFLGTEPDKDEKK